MKPQSPSSTGENDATPTKGQSSGVFRNNRSTKKTSRLMMQITPGKRLLWQEHLVEVDGVISPSQVCIRDLVTGKSHEVPIGELQALERRENDPTDLTSVPDDKWKVAKTRAKALQPLIRLGRIPASKRTRIAAALGISERQLRRLLKQFRNSPRVLTLVKSTPGPSQGSSRLSIKQEEAIAETLSLFYDSETPKDPPDLMDNLEARCKRQGCPTPSISAVRRRIKAIEDDRACSRREARAATRQRHKAHTGRHEVKEPLEWVQIDHTLVDVILITDDRYRAPIGRPWITCVIDVATRCILGFYLSLDRPAAESVGGALVRTMLPKDVWLRQMGLKEVDWPMYGPPKTLHADNAWEFDSMALKRGCDEFRIELSHRPKRTPRYGGHIERYLGTFARRIHAIPGTTFSNPKDRDGYKSEAHAIKTLTETRAWIIYEIMRYHSTEHRGLNKKTPRHVWINAFTSEEGQYCPPPVPIAGEALLLDFLPSELRKVQRDGVSFDTLRYVPADPDFDLSPYVGRPDPILIHFDRRDISFIYFRSDDGPWVALRPSDPDFRPISRTEFAAQRRLERAAAHDPNDLSRRIVAVEGQERLLRKSRSATREAHKRTRREASRLDLAAQSHLPRNPPQIKPVEDLAFDPDDIPTPPVEQWAD